MKLQKLFAAMIILTEETTDTTTEEESGRQNSSTSLPQVKIMKKNREKQTKISHE